MKTNKIRVIVFLYSLIAAFIFTSCKVSISLADERSNIDKAIAFYQHEDYEEALDILKGLSTETPQSSTAAYYLGLTYKKLQNLTEAAPNLERATKLEPKINNAVPELIDTLYQSGDTDSAKRWIETAEKGGPASAQISFLKGMVLLKEKKDLQGAIEAFAQAQKLDQTLEGTVKYYKGMVYLQMEDLKNAKAAFNQIIIKDPTASMAAYANEYVDAIARKEKADKPYRGNVGYAIQYDDNVILKPQDNALAEGIGNKGDWRSAYSGQAEYNYKPNEHFGAKAGYSFYCGKEFDLGFYDMVSNDVSLTPAFYLDKLMASFPIHYNNIRVNDKRYLDMAGISSANNIMLDRVNMAQITFTHNRKYFKWPAARDNDDRDSREYLASAGWFYFFAKNYEGFASARYTMNYEDAKGKNWTYFGNRFSLSSTIPLTKRVKWSVVGEYFRQDFSKVNSTYEKARSDNVFTFSNLVAVKLFKDCEMQLQYTYVNDGASIGVFKYDRDIYSVGIKYEF